MQAITGWLMTVVTGALLMSGTTRADNPNQVPKKGGLASGANVGQGVSGQTGNPTVNPPTTPLNQGIGQIVSGWTHQGIHGQELAERIHQLLATRHEQHREAKAARKEAERERKEEKKEGERERKEDKKGAKLDRKEDKEEENGAEKVGSQGGKHGKSGGQGFHEEKPHDHFVPGPVQKIPLGKGGKFHGKGKK